MEYLDNSTRQEATYPLCRKVLIFSDSEEEQLAASNKILEFSDFIRSKFPSQHIYDSDITQIEIDDLSVIAAYNYGLLSTLIIESTCYQIIATRKNSSLFVSVYLVDGFYYCDTVLLSGIIDDVRKRLEEL